MDSLRPFLLDQGIPVEYELDTFNTPPQEQLYVTPKIGYVDCDAESCSNTKPLFHLWATFSRDHMILPEITRNTNSW